MSNDPCLEPAYADWGTQDLTAAQRKRHRTSTVGGGTPNKATLTLATEPDHSDDEFWKEAASIAGELERAHQNVRGTTAKVKRKRQQQQSGNSTKTAKNRQAEKKAETECSESHNSTQTATKNRQAEAAGTTDNSTKTARNRQAEAAGTAKTRQPKSAGTTDCPKAASTNADTNTVSNNHTRWQIYHDRRRCAGPISP